MNKSTKIISSLAALGALCVGTAAMASPWHNGNCPGAGVPEAQCPIAADGPRADGPRFNKPSRQVDPAVRAARWDAIARMLTIKPEQEAAWKAYTAARDAERTPIAKTDDKKLAVDVQTRLQLRADRAKVRADLLAKSAQARAGRCVHRTARTRTAVGIKTALMVRTTIHHACTVMEFHAFEHILLFG